MRYILFLCILFSLAASGQQKKERPIDIKYSYVPTGTMIILLRDTLYVPYGAAKWIKIGETVYRVKGPELELPAALIYGSPAWRFADSPSDAINYPFNAFLDSLLMKGGVLPDTLDLRPNLVIDSTFLSRPRLLNVVY